VRTSPVERGHARVGGVQRVERRRPFRTARCRAPRFPCRVEPESERATEVPGWLRRTDR